jgi:leucyl-tRNA synthetase
MVKEKYHHKQIEKKWQKIWEEKGSFAALEDTSKPKYYILDMFPYPSGSGLHVGHLVGYTATDIMARYKRQKGYNVLHPMGWDSFGLPAEQYAVRTGTHPRETTKKNVDNFRRQLKSVGFSYDWNREFATSDPSYYKWTQWIFTKLYEKGLAYEAEVDVNYCPHLGTVLANEEVEGNVSKEGGHPVEKRPLRQWVLKITEYADRLLEDLDELDWPEGIKKLQANWIGKSEGAHVDFSTENGNEICVFTTRPDTLFGATYIVLAPEHPLVSLLSTQEQKESVQNYIEEAKRKSDLDRADLTKEKTGVFTGSYAINPVNKERLPIWVSDYVMMGYGTGAIMSVPAHDDRDFAFAKKYNLPIRPVYRPLIQGNEEVLEGEGEEKVVEDVLQGRRPWSYAGNCMNSANEEVSLNDLSVEEAKKKITDWLERRKVGKKAITYKLRDWLFSRQRYWGEPFPVLHLADGTKRILGIDELPLTPPELEDFKPAGDGQSPLAKSSDWVNIIDPKTKQPAQRETNTMPQWAGSCWYYLRFCDPHNNEKAWDEKKEKYWLPVDLYMGGVEHAVLHLLYARFWHKVLYDLGLASTKEPFRTLRNQGLIVAKSFKNSRNEYIPAERVEKKGELYIDTKTQEVLRWQVEKMSKSKLNGVSPDQVIEEFGADSVRLYEMFMGPVDREKIWNTEAITGCRRFLSRFWEMAHSDLVKDEKNEKAEKLGARLVDGVTKDIESMQFNTAIAKLMEFLNDFTKLPVYPFQEVKKAVQCLYPFAPHIAEEIWEDLGQKEPLAYTDYPKIDPALLEEDSILFVVQINGKVRGKLPLPKGLAQEEVEAAARKESNVQQYLEGKEVRKVVFVPNKLISFVL